MSTVMVHHPYMTQHKHTPTHTKLHTHLFCCVWQVEVHLSMVMVHHPSMTPHMHTPTHTHPHTPTHTSFASFYRFGRVEVFMSTVMVHHPSMTQHTHTHTHTHQTTHAPLLLRLAGGGTLEHGDGAPFPTP